ncbi:hypothetical protein PC120_g9451 [Phytophthora cactorum]|nr:hypothetical protein PC120_g9451 [Phytophthora cactorum]
MRCSKLGCTLASVVAKAPCCVCSHHVHHICSNEICDDTELSKRFVVSCVRNYKNIADDSQESTSPLNSPGTSVSSQASEVYVGAETHDIVWDVIHTLQDPVTIKGKTYTHICTLCAQTKSWKKALCICANTSNAKQSKRPVPDGGSEQDTKRQRTLFGLSKTQKAGLVAQWLICDGLPFNRSQTPAFKEIFCALTGDPTATVISAKTHNDLLNVLYEKILRETAKMLQNEFGLLCCMRFLNLMHDMWTNVSKDCIVGTSILFIEHNWKIVYMALLVVTKEDSTTRPAARKVSFQFGTTLQTDCAMHCLNLCIGYGVGLKENVIYRVVTDPVTKAKMKKRVFVTEGAVQRGHKLTEVQQLHGLPEISGPIDIDVRVESVVKLFQRSIVNYTAYQWYFRTVPDAKKDMEVFICISTAEWELVVEMEAIVQRVAELACIVLEMKQRQDRTPNCFHAPQTVGADGYGVAA